MDLTKAFKRILPPMIAGAVCFLGATLASSLAGRHSDMVFFLTGVLAFPHALAWAKSKVS